MYEILYKDTKVFDINIQNGEVIIYDKDRLPFDIYVEVSDDFDDRVNNIVNFNSWCANRVLSLDREYSKDILNYLGFSQVCTDKEKAKIAISTRCLSINDCFWLRNSEENISWNEVNLFDNCLENALFEVALLGKTPTITNAELISPDISTDGTAAKAWLRKENYFYLLKGDKNDSVRKEVEASKILNKLGFPCVNYEYDYFDGHIVSKCKCYTNKDVSLVRAGWLEIWCMNHDCDIRDYIYKFSDCFDRMNLADYLIGNKDEHQYNWGFLYGNEMNIISMNPHMDFDHAFEGDDFTICLPALFLGEKISQKDMAIKILQKHPDWLNTDADLSEFKYGTFTKQRIKSLIKEV